MILTIIYESGKSVLIYQHFPHKNRKDFICEKFDELEKVDKNGKIVAIQTSHVVFLALIHKDHWSRFEKGLGAIKMKWPAKHMFVVSRDEIRELCNTNSHFV